MGSLLSNLGFAGRFLGKILNGRVLIYAFWVFNNVSGKFHTVCWWGMPQLDTQTQSSRSLPLPENTEHVQPVKWLQRHSLK